MRIGIDLDGVVFDTEKMYRVYAELYEVQDLKRNSIIERYFSKKDMLGVKKN